MSEIADLYQELGVAESASADEIRAAYKKLAKRWHPDREGGDEARFKRIAAAFEVLGDPDKRKLYDEFGPDSLRPGFDPDKMREYRDAVASGPWGFGGFRRGGAPSGQWEDVFADLFGQAQRGPVQGRDLQAVVELDFMEAIGGTELSIQVPRGGKLEMVTVRIPPGADDGSKLTVRGKGQPGREGGPAGDLLITTRVRPHPRLTRDGLDLEMTLPVTLDEAYNGARVEVPTIDGKVALEVPPGSQPGTRLRLRGKGVRRGKRRGDLFVRLELRLPDRHDPGFADAARQASRLYSEPPRRSLHL